MRPALAAIVIGAWLAGCGAGGARHPVRVAVAQAQRTHEYRSPAARAPEQRVSAAAASPEQAISAFAAAYINWNAGDVVARLTALAGASAGQARSLVALAAARAGGDYELRRAGIANSGTVETVGRLAGSPDRYVVVTRERTTAANTSAYDGLAPAWHVEIATVRQAQGGGWVVSGWQPES